MRTLYGYWRSSAAYRVRIVLELKGLDYRQVSIDLRSGAQQAPDYLRRNPQGLVPFLEDGDVGLSQSIAICEYLEEVYPQPRLLPEGPADRARVRALCALIACEIHPLNNLRVLNHLRSAWNFDEEQVLAWYRHWIREGFVLVEQELARTAGRCAFGDTPTLADAFLVPQVYNARRYGCPLEAFPTVVRVDAHLNTLPAFVRAKPERQPDAPA
jgi:maleylacetoacetate isomerase